MKGKKGESPMNGVRVDNPPPPCTGGSRIMAAAKKRKRGGAVKADIKVEGDMPKMRMDRPKRARGGGLMDQADKSASSAMDKKPSKMGDILKSKALKARPEVKRSSPMDSKVFSAKWDGVDRDDGRKRGGAVKKRMSGGRVGADTKPFTHAREERPAKGHSTSGDL